MEDKEKDWHACAVHCFRMHEEAVRMDRVVMGAGPFTWAMRGAAASLHHGGEGWAWIRKHLPGLTVESLLWLKSWTT